MCNYIYVYVYCINNSEGKRNVVSTWIENVEVAEGFVVVLAAKQVQPVQQFES